MTEVKLLSGGNPQIPKGDGEEPVQAYIAAVPGWKQPLVAELDALITELVPGVQKAVRWNTPFYGVEGQGWFLGFHCLTRYVKISWFKGSSLTPQPWFEAKHPEVRYSHIHEDEVFDEEQMLDWIRQAAALPGEKLF